MLESLISWAGVADELDFAKSLQEWSSNGFKELGDRDGFYVCDVISQVTTRQFSQDLFSGPIVQTLVRTKMMLTVVFCVCCFVCRLTLVSDSLLQLLLFCPWYTGGER